MSTTVEKSLERLQQKSNSECKLKNVKLKKSQKLYCLGHFIQLKNKQKKPLRKPVLTIYIHKKNLLRKCKYRDSKLKKSILKYRFLKQSRIEETLTPNIEKTSNLATVDVTEGLETLTLGAGHISGIHSRRFRDYCDNTTSQELCNSVTVLLRDLNRFQKRAFKKNPYKARCRRRFVIGFREVQAKINLNKIKLVIVATDCEKCEIEGGLDSIILNIKDECKRNNIPYVFALQRRHLSYALFKKSPLSCVGIIDYDGVHDIYLKLLSILEEEKKKYKYLLEHNKN